MNELWPIVHSHVMERYSFLTSKVSLLRPVEKLIQILPYLALYQKSSLRGQFNNCDWIRENLTQSPKTKFTVLETMGEYSTYISLKKLCTVLNSLFIHSEGKIMNIILFFYSSGVRKSLFHP